tara:strand:- start:37 stop:489 length:453 start_codon:yes stop_codon:yes gene_type:complete
MVIQIGDLEIDKNRVMSKEKSAKIVKSVFSNEWCNPSGGTTYYYDIELDNNDAGAVGVTTKDSERVQVGQKIKYNINGTKIKVVEVEKEAVQKTSYKAYKGKNSQESFLGYAWSYAKDLHIAGKTMEDIEELNSMARYIYDEIGKMLNNE